MMCVWNGDGYIHIKRDSTYECVPVLVNCIIRHLDLHIDATAEYLLWIVLTY